MNHRYSFLYEQASSTPYRTHPTDLSNSSIQENIGVAHNVPQDLNGPQISHDTSDRFSKKSLLLSESATISSAALRNEKEPPSASQLCDSLLNALDCISRDLEETDPFTQKIFALYSNILALQHSFLSNPDELDPQAHSLPSDTLVPTTRQMKFIFDDFTNEPQKLTKQQFIQESSLHLRDCNLCQERQSSLFTAALITHQLIHLRYPSSDSRSLQSIMDQIPHTQDLITDTSTSFRLLTEQTNKLLTQTSSTKSALANIGRQIEGTKQTLNLLIEKLKLLEERKMKVHEADVTTFQKQELSMIEFMFDPTVEENK